MASVTQPPPIVSVPATKQPTGSSVALPAGHGQTSKPEERPIPADSKAGKTAPDPAAKASALDETRQDYEVTASLRYYFGFYVTDFSEKGMKITNGFLTEGFGVSKEAGEKIINQLKKAGLLDENNYFTENAKNIETLIGKISEIQSLTATEKDKAQNAFRFADEANQKIKTSKNSGGKNGLKHGEIEALSNSFFYKYMGVRRKNDGSLNAEFNLSKENFDAFFKDSNDNAKALYDMVYSIKKFKEQNALRSSLASRVANLVYPVAGLNSDQSEYLLDRDYKNASGSFLKYTAEKLYDKSDVVSEAAQIVGVSDVINNNTAIAKTALNEKFGKFNLNESTRSKISEYLNRVEGTDLRSEQLAAFLEIFVTEMLAGNKQKIKIFSPDKKEYSFIGDTITGREYKAPEKQEQGKTSVGAVSAFLATSYKIDLDFIKNNKLNETIMREVEKQGNLDLKAALHTVMQDIKALKKSAPADKEKLEKQEKNFHYLCRLQIKKFSEQQDINSADISHVLALLKELPEPINDPKRSASHKPVDYSVNIEITKLIKKIRRDSSGTEKSLKDLDKDTLLLIAQLKELTCGGEDQSSIQQISDNALTTLYEKDDQIYASFKEKIPEWLQSKIKADCVVQQNAAEEQKKAQEKAKKFAERIGLQLS